ncbi:type II secretion system protein GspE [Oceanidesulfovibrio indonesiensis]|uniref:Type II secretion system protein GspE n=1 Tax=Oceanidesulfovibrio indonesiensis TaxID=54767 RepID=A0A7M3MEN7_9BACT|nr:GspE/PulE family protein [Oceanidesulfovibrio indonesiensis]TVM16923.1 type II secretion system protein GspE [Oceanidesulfovibrio indonesiensis]
MPEHRAQLRAASGLHRGNGGAKGSSPLNDRQLGSAFVERGLITEEQLREALRIKVKENIPLGEALRRLGHVTEEDVARAIADCSGIPYINLDDVVIDPAAAKLLPPGVAERQAMVPLRLNEDNFEAAVDRPLSAQALKNIERRTRRCVVLHIASSGKIRDALARIYEKSMSAELDDGSAVEIVNDIILKALRLKASDIHLEPGEDTVRLRFRIDGVLQEIKRYSPDMLASLTSRIKVMAGLNIAERRSPQDGAIVFEDVHENFDLRVSTLPIVHGEKVVLRILAGYSNRLTIDQLGLSSEDYGKFSSIIRRPYGIICIVGPTGSGKSTTLCAALNTINHPDINITTVEDPVEYKINGVNQVQIRHNEKISFASALRSILRQDPDVIMVGETRDQETASISLRAALTGHLVFTTLHTNDAPGALPRLVDMGCEPFLVASSVSGILAQRLVRRLCQKCKERFTPDAAMLKSLGVTSANGDHPEAASWCRPVGCPSCFNTGYRGRTGVFELMLVNDEVRSEILRNGSTESIRRAALDQGMTTLRADAVNKAMQGATSVEEVLRVTVGD